MDRAWGTQGAGFSFNSWRELPFKLIQGPWQYHHILSFQHHGWLASQKKLLVPLHGSLACLASKKSESQRTKDAPDHTSLVLLCCHRKEHTT